MTCTLSAQKVVKKTIVNERISSVQIDGGNIFEIQLNTHDGNEMILEARIDGEYNKELKLNIEEKGSTLIVSGDFEEGFKNPNDKLSAHKVISIAINISLPVQKYVNIFGTSCNVFTKGDFKQLTVTLNDGSCALNNTEGMIAVTSQSGNIWVESSAASINAVSKYGTVKKDSIPSGNSQFDLKTTTGNIEIIRIE